jgi:hypothetical protein
VAEVHGWQGHLADEVAVARARADEALRNGAPIIED